MEHRVSKTCVRTAVSQFACSEHVESNTCLVCGTRNTRSTRGVPNTCFQTDIIILCLILPLFFLPPTMNATSTKRQRAPHRKLIGTERCSHSCPERLCTNSKGTLEWAREGGSVRRHEKSTKRHPLCAEGCLGYTKLQEPLESGKGKSSRTLKAATTSEDPSDPMDVDTDTEDNFPGPSNVSGPSNLSSGI